MDQVGWVKPSKDAVTIEAHPNKGKISSTPLGIEPQRNNTSKIDEEPDHSSQQEETPFVLPQIEQFYSQGNQN